MDTPYTTKRLFIDTSWKVLVITVKHNKQITAVTDSGCPSLVEDMVKGVELTGQHLFAWHFRLTHARVADHIGVRSVALGKVTELPMWLDNNKTPTSVAGEVMSSIDHDVIRCFLGGTQLFSHMPHGFAKPTTSTGDTHAADRMGEPLHHAASVY